MVVREYYADGAGSTISQVLAGTKISPIYSQTSLINKKKVYENYPVRIVRNVPGNVGLRQ